MKKIIPTKLKLTTSKAREILWACDRSVNVGKGEVSWHAQTRHLNHAADNSNPLIAIGTAAGNTRTIRFVESLDFLETTFQTGDKQFESLWNAGNHVHTPIESLG